MQRVPDNDQSRRRQGPIDYDFYRSEAIRLRRAEIRFCGLRVMDFTRSAGLLMRSSWASRINRREAACDGSAAPTGDPADGATGRTGLVRRLLPSRVAQLSALVAAFALSHAFRTLPTAIVGHIGRDLAADAGELGLFSGAFHAAFAVMQLPVGLALDRYSLARTVGILFCATVLGAMLCTVASTIPVLIAGQILIGIGCSPALMAAMIYVSRHWPPDRFAAVSGLVIALGGLGMLVTATPLIWVVEHFSWRSAFALLALVSAVITALCFLIDDAGAGTTASRRETLSEAIRGFAAVLAAPHVRGILALGLFSYSTAITVRGLWIVPLLVERLGLSTVEASNVVLGVSIAMIAGPAFFGAIDPGPAHRRWLITVSALVLVMTTILLVLPQEKSIIAEVAIAVIFGLASSFYVLQYAEIRSSYSQDMVGRALCVLNTSVFIGIAIAQSASGFVASLAAAHGVAPILAVFLMLAANLCAGVAVYALLPGSDLARSRAV